MSGTIVTAHNWGQPPSNRWSFQHMQSLFPTARLRRGVGPITEFDSQPADVLNLSYIGLDGVMRPVRESLDETYTDAFLVLKNGEVLAEHYFNEMAADSFHLLNSVTKSFVGMLAGILVDQGLLHVDDAVTRHLPELADTAFADTKVRHLLDMSAAVTYDEDYAEPHADFWLESAVIGWRPGLVTRDTPGTLLDYANSLKQRDQPDGAQFHYRTVLTNVLGMVCERAGGRKLQNLLQSELWGRLGPEQDAVIIVDQAGFPYVGAGMSACARDLARFGQMLTQKGKFNGTQIVPATWIKDVLQVDDHCRRIFADSEYGDFIPGGHYRNKLWVKDADKGVLLALGIHGQIIYMDQSNDVVIVKLSSQPESVLIEMFQDNFAAMDAISAAV